MPAIFTATPDGAIAVPNDAADTSGAFTRWQTHLTAGRLTAAAPRTPSPQIAANRARTEAIVRAHAAARREALRTTGFRERD